jgi:predicted Zn-dependent protease
LVDESLRRESKNAGALLRRANLEFVDGNYAASEKTLQELIALRPAEVEARTALGRVAEAKGDLPAAQKSLQDAVAISPDNMVPAMMLAALHLRSGHADEATRVFDALIAAGAKDGVAANAAGMALIKAGRAAEARTRFGQAVEQAPGESRYWFNLGRAQLLAADRPAAILSVERAVKLRPDWVEANAAAIQLNLESKQLASAAELTRAFAARLPGDPTAWLMVGQVAQAESRAEDAVAAFARSYALRPSEAAAVREYRARVAGKARRPAQPLLNWLIQEPADTNVRRLLAQYYQRVGAGQELVAQLEKILATMPNDAITLNNLSWAIVTTDPKRAEALARRANAIAPQEPKFADTLGRALIANGKYADAVRFLADAVKGLPEDPSIRTRYASALAGSGDRGAARREVQLALKESGVFDERKTAEKLLQELET